MIKINNKLSNVLKTNFILILIPIFIVSLFTLQILEVYAKKVISDKNLILAEAAADEIEVYLDQPLSILRQLEDVITEKEFVDQQEIRSYLETTIDNYKIFESIQLLNQKGEIKYAAPFNQNIIGLDMSEQDFFQETIKRKESYWSPSFISLHTGQPTVTITMPIKNGMVVAYLNLAKLNDFNNKIHVGKENFFIAITDQKGNFISHYDKEKVYQRVNKNQMEKVIYNEDTYQTNYEGKEMLVSVSYVKNTNWRVVIYQSKDEAFAPVRRVRDIFIAGLIISIIIAILISTSSAKKILLSFNNLTRKTKEIASGNYNFNLKYDSYREFNDLAESINMMSENIKLREQALQESEKKFRALFHNANDSVFLWKIINNELPGQFIEVNEVACRRLGYSREELLARTFEDINVKEKRHKITEGIQSLLTHGKSTFELYCMAKSGVKIPVEISARIFYLNGSRVVLSIARDITERKRAERALKGQKERLRAYAKSLEETNRELEQFAYVASHDLKAPLRGIANLSEWIEEDLRDVLQDETRSMMDLLRGRVRRMEALIDGILQYSRVGRTRVEYQVVNIGTLLRELITDLDLPQEFTVKIESGMPTINTDRTRLMQVFANLISNAFKHHNRTDGTVTISVRDCGEFNEFVVTDDGPGIAPEYHAKVFEIFQTLQPRDKVESTGVGLAIVKKIIENQGGTIRLESEEGQGVKFYFTWPKTQGLSVKL